MNNQMNLNPREVQLIRKLLNSNVQQLQVDNPVLLSTVTLSVGVPTETYSVGGLDGFDPVSGTRVGTMTNIRDPSDPYDASPKDYVDTKVDNAVFSTDVLFSTSTQVAQSPTVLDTPIRIELGAEVLSGDVTLTKNDPGDIEASILTFNTPGIYNVKLDLSMGRTGSTGIAALMVQTEFNGIYQSNQIIFDYFDAADFHARRLILKGLNITGGETLVFWLARWSIGGAAVNDGGLFTVDPTAQIPTFTVLPTAAIKVIRTK